MTGGRRHFKRGFFERGMPGVWKSWDWRHQPQRPLAREDGFHRSQKVLRVLFPLLILLEFCYAYTAMISPRQISTLSKANPVNLHKLWKYARKQDKFSLPKFGQPFRRAFVDAPPLGQSRRDCLPLRALPVRLEWWTPSNQHRVCANTAG